MQLVLHEKQTESLLRYNCWKGSNVTECYIINVTECYRLFLKSATYYPLNCSAWSAPNSQSPNLSEITNIACTVYINSGDNLFFIAKI